MQNCVTLRQIWTDYQVARNLKPKTLKVYSNSLNRCVGDWFDTDLTLIDRSMIEERYQFIGQTRKALANLTMRILRALFTFARYRHDAKLPNPVATLSETRSWHRIPRRRRFIASQQMPDWFRTVLECENRDNRDLHLILMFCGFRKNEATQLTWTDVDFVRETINIKDTKNGDPHELPMSTHVRAILQKRRLHKKADPLYVFRGRWEKTALSQHCRGYQEIAEDSGVPFHFHDLRRTFATVADDLDIPIPVIKRLLNHRSNDVTLGYLCNGIERLRKPLQAINDEMLRRAGIEKI